MLSEDKQKGTRRKRPSFGQSNNHLSDSGLGLRSSEVGNSLIEQPSFIDFDDIEGEYRG
jgi:hypothetical protein